MARKCCTAMDAAAVKAAAAAAKMEEARAALSTLSMVMKESEAPRLRTLQLFDDLGLADEHEELEAAIVSTVDNVIAVAEGAAGDRVKYAAACKQMLRRWRVFIALMHVSDEEEPTIAMVKQFCGFMYKFRQRRSSAGRQGLGDAVAEMAQYTLGKADFVFDVSCSVEIDVPTQYSTVLRSVATSNKDVDVLA